MLAGSGLEPSELDKRLHAAVAPMQACKVDGDCILVTVSCGQEAVAKPKAKEAEDAMRAVCPKAGAAGGPGPVIPKAKCADGRCTLVSP